MSLALDADTVVVGDQASATLIALAKTTGALVWKTTVAINLDAFITFSPILVHGRVYVGVFSNQEYAATVVPGFQLDFRGSVVGLKWPRWQASMADLYGFEGVYRRGSVVK